MVVLISTFSLHCKCLVMEHDRFSSTQSILIVPPLFSGEQFMNKRDGYGVLLSLGGWE